MPSGRIPSVFVAALVVFLLAAWALRTIISERSARYFLVENAQAEALTGWLYLSPNLLGFLAFFAGPLVFSMVISFYDWDGVSQAVYVGLDNYINTLSAERGRRRRRTCRRATRRSSACPSATPSWAGPIRCSGSR